jgi:hypothetical protein
MKATFFILIGMLVLLTAIAVFWLWFVIRRPGQWAALVDKENAFWVRRGIISEAFAEKCKRLEKGPVQKVMIGGVAVIGAGVLAKIGFLLLKTGFLAHRF